MNKNSLSRSVICILIVLFLVRIVFLSGAGSKLEYSQFITEVQQGRISEVKLGANPQLLPASSIGTKAFVKTINHERKVVDIPANDTQLVKIIVDGVIGNIEIPSKNNWHVWYEELYRVFTPWLMLLFGMSELLYVITNQKQWLKARACVALSLVFVVLIMCAHQYWGQAKIHNPLPYSLFIQKVQDGKIKSISLLPDRSRAVVDDRDGYRDIVNLPPDNRLNDILTQNVKGKIDTISDDRFNEIVIKNNAKVKGFKNYSK